MAYNETRNRISDTQLARISSYPCLVMLTAECFSYSIFSPSLYLAFLPSAFGNMKELATLPLEEIKMKAFALLSGILPKHGCLQLLFQNGLESKDTFICSIFKKNHIFSFSSLILTHTLFQTLWPLLLIQFGQNLREKWKTPPLIRY